MDINGEDMEWLIQSSNFVEMTTPIDVAKSAKDEKELSTLLKVLKSFSITAPKLEDSTAFAVLSSETDFHAFLRHLKALGYFYAIRNSHVNKKNADTKLLWAGHSEKTTKHPYIVDKLVKYNCSVGRLLKKQAQEANGNKNNTCCAVMTYKQVSVFSTVKTPVNKQRRLELRRTICSMIAEGNARTEQEYWIWVPFPRLHDHPIRPGALRDRRLLDPEVKAAMFDIVRDEPMTVEQVKEKLYDLVNKEFAHSKVKPSVNNPAFFPTDKAIYNHLRNNSLTRKRIQRPPTLDQMKFRAERNLKDLAAAVDKCSDIDTIKKVIPLLQKSLKMLRPPSETLAEAAETENEEIPLLDDRNHLILDV